MQTSATTSIVTIIVIILALVSFSNAKDLPGNLTVLNNNHVRDYFVDGWINCQFIAPKVNGGDTLIKLYTAYTDKYNSQNWQIIPFIGNEYLTFNMYAEEGVFPAMVINSFGQSYTIAYEANFETTKKLRALIIELFDWLNNYNDRYLSGFIKVGQFA